MTARALLLATALLAFPGLAAAQDAAPVISEIRLNGRRVNRVGLGSVVELVGSGFPDDDAEGRHPEGLEVALGGQSVMLLNAQTNAVTVLIPQFDMPTGRLPLRVTVAGRGSAEVEVEVVRLRGDPTEQPRRQPEPGEQDQLLAAFRITRFALLRDEPGVRFEAEGTVPVVIPHGFVVDVFLSHEGWAKQRFLPALAAARAGQRAFQSRSAFPLEPAADERSARALDLCDLLLCAWSRDLYAGANLPVPDLLVAPTDLPPTKNLGIELEASRLGALRAAGLERP